MNKEKEIRNIGKLIILHLLPGIVISTGYVFLLKVEVLAEYPKVVVLGLAIVLFLLPTELGILFCIAKKEKGTFNIFEVLGLKSNMKIKEYILYAFSIFAMTGIIITVLKPISDYILKNVFSWIPSWYNLTQDMSGFSKNVIIITIIVEFFFVSLLGPIIEELYFRGYLLARMKWMGKYGVLFNVILFSIYHFWSPWLIIARVVAMLPLYYCVYKKDSLKLGITVHCLCNLTDVVALIMLLR